MNKRRKVYSIAIPIFLVLSLVLGAWAQFGGSAYRNKYFYEGAQLGYAAGAQTGYEYGMQVGYYYGYNEGGRIGYAYGLTDGYVETVLDMDDPAHLAALELERQFLDIDIQSMTTLSLRGEHEGEQAIVVLIGYPAVIDADAHTITLVSIEDWDPALIKALVAMVKSAYDGEPYIKLAVGAPINYDIYMYDWIIYPAAEFLQGDLSGGVHDDGSPLTLENAMRFSLIATMWPFNPYGIKAQQEEAIARAGGGGSENNPE